MSIQTPIERPKRFDRRFLIGAATGAAATLVGAACVAAGVVALLTPTVSLPQASGFGTPVPPVMADVDERFTIQATIFADLNGNGVRDAGEPSWTEDGLNVTAVAVDANGFAQTYVERTDTTEFWGISHTQPQTWSITYELPDGYVTHSPGLGEQPVDGRFSIVVPVTQSDEIVRLDIGLTEEASS